MVSFVAGLEGVIRVTGHMCALGMADVDGRSHRKTTTLKTNDKVVADVFRPYSVHDRMSEGDTSFESVAPCARMHTLCHCRQSRPSCHYQAKIRPSLYVWSTEAKTGDTGDAATVEAFQRHAQDEYVHAGLSASGPEPLPLQQRLTTVKSEGNHRLVHRSECWSNVHVTSLSCQHLLHTPNRRDDQTDDVKTNSSTVDVSYDFDNTWNRDKA